MRGTVVFALALGGLIGSTAVSSCGLIDLDSFNRLEFKLPTRMFAVTTNDPRWRPPPQIFSQAIPCATTDNCCAPPGLPPLNCSQFPLQCDAGQCALQFPFEITQTINLAQDAPELTKLKGKVISEILLETLEYTVTSQLNVALPVVTLYVAPASVTSASSPMARPLATIPMTSAGVTVSETIRLSAEAQQTFSTFARDFETPFNILASTTILVRSGSPPPQGRVDVKISGQVVAKL